ncbi:hypothetical protein COV93_07920 [Candidatus Woesearchaeota archaeon CG11_big_fil_rev_8_21_14_0_20_43_8]|nr:MAG: hypothetical protein COV93_07920 [Candidatus Woesearchaeota archaeon CG11_big_fil_rev_8_21_14_0_20_43_8]PIO05522.1 MAG: hypothetical protein COT47_04430 [Candidatus Woesearchaeota archaeon CG08_land_8_20_14_0_20_43_7]
MLKKAQAATEYLIVLAVVVVIALIVVVILGGVPGIGNQVSGRASAAFWDSADVAVTDYAISASGTDTVMIKNNLRSPITLNVVSVNSVDLETGTSTIGVGGTKTYTGDVGACTAGQTFSYAVMINYTDTSTDATYSFDGAGMKLEGKCAN